MAKISKIESIAISTYKQGMFFYTDKQDKDITAIANYYGKRVKTERFVCIDQRYMNKIVKLIKVTIL